jgi:hypothetical protein
MKQVRGIIPLEQRGWCIVHVKMYDVGVKSCNGALVAIDILQARFSEQAITDFWSKVSCRYLKHSKVSERTLRAAAQAHASQAGHAPSRTASSALFRLLLTVRKKTVRSR